MTVMIASGARHSAQPYSLGRLVAHIATLRRMSRADAGSPLPFPSVLAHTIMHAPSFSLRGGTREILRGIIARGLGLR